jgi:hypothetical protein
MHLLSRQMPSEEERIQQQAFADRILSVGDGSTTINEVIEWPIDGIIPDNTLKPLAEAIYPGINIPNAPLPTAQYLAGRALLAARNYTVNILNKTLLDIMPGEEFVSLSADKILDDPDGAETYAMEYLNALNLPTLPGPLHELKLKIAAPIILLRNL